MVLLGSERVCCDIWKTATFEIGERSVVLDSCRADMLG